MSTRTWDTVWDSSPLGLRLETGRVPAATYEDGIAVRLVWQDPSDRQQRIVLWETTLTDTEQLVGLQDVFSGAYEALENETMSELDTFEQAARAAAAEEDTYRRAEYFASR